MGHAANGYDEIEEYEEIAKPQPGADVGGVDDRIAQGSQVLRLPGEGGGARRHFGGRRNGRPRAVDGGLRRALDLVHRHLYVCHGFAPHMSMQSVDAGTMDRYDRGGKPAAKPDREAIEAQG